MSKSLQQEQWTPEAKPHVFVEDKLTAKGLVLGQEAVNNFMKERSGLWCRIIPRDRMKKSSFLHNLVLILAREKGCCIWGKRGRRKFPDMPKKCKKCSRALNTQGSHEIWWKSFKTCHNKKFCKSFWPLVWLTSKDVSSCPKKFSVSRNCFFCHRKVIENNVFVNLNICNNTNSLWKFHRSPPTVWKAKNTYFHFFVTSAVWVWAIFLSFFGKTNHPSQKK